MLSHNFITLERGGGERRAERTATNHTFMFFFDLIDVLARAGVATSHSAVHYRTSVRSWFRAVVAVSSQQTSRRRPRASRPLHLLRLALE